MVKLSVVMAVYNGAHSLVATMESILTQTERDFELIVIDDGSRDETPSILAGYATRDARVRVITQPNAGLTRSLIRGCLEARAPYIARHDCGERSYPERFAKQVALIERGHVLVSCATRYVDSDGDTLYVSRADGEEVRNSLLNDGTSRIHGITSHGSAIFRRDAYLAAGGYRPQFRTAQDLDLWIRLAALGTIALVDEILFETTVEVRGISGSGRATQVRLTEIAVALRDGGDEETLLGAAASVTPPPMTPRGEAAALYFIGKCLLKQRNRKGLRYLRETIRRNPFHFRAWASLVLGR